MISASQSNRFRQLAKSMQLGRIFYQIYHAPKGFLKKCHQRGVINMAIDHWAAQQMESAAHRLPPVSIHDAPTFDIHFLSGRKFWYQTCFCAYSMAQHVDVNLRPVVYDDGTLTKAYADGIRRIFPNSKIVSIEEIQDQLEQYLPSEHFPYLRERRANYPNMRKLTDIHIGSQRWKLVLDSDMLFFNSPACLVNWLKAAEKPCCMIDTETSYGYSEELMESLTEAPIPELINVGICGLNSSLIDWEKLEFWCKTLIEEEGTHYYQEQALVAMLFSGNPFMKAPVDEYVVMPNKEDVIHPKAILHHYVADSKPWYFRHGWKYVSTNSFH